LGERRSLLAIRERVYGVHHFTRIPGYIGAAKDIPADRLRKLEAGGAVERRQHSAHPPRYEYHLPSPAGNCFRRCLLPVGTVTVTVPRPARPGPLDDEPRASA
jgi:DNA-binding HxlR family transcriptional regulator